MRNRCLSFALPVLLTLEQIRSSMKCTTPVTSLAGPRPLARGLYFFDLNGVLLLSISMNTNVYIDGFNLYHRALEYSPYKWLDLDKLCQALLPSHQINRIRYFTAIVDQRPNDPQQQRRQLVYLRALRTIPSLEIHYGQFRTNEKRRPLVRPISGLPNSVLIKNTEEKGSDVNLATYLIMDGYDGEYEQAVVISNDSDFALPIKMVRDKLNFPVGVINPGTKDTTPKELRDSATFQRRIYKKTLRDCQFPDTMADANGTVTKPSKWII